MDEQRARSLTATVASIPVAVVLTTSTAVAQNVAQPPQRSSELEKLASFIGDWTTEGEMNARLFNPSLRSTFVSADHMERMPGGFFVTGRAESVTPNGRQFQLSILGYDSREKVYTFNSFNNAGLRTSATGTFDGETWTWTNQQDIVAGTTVAVRHTIRVLSPSAYTFRFEITTDGTTWSTFSKGKTTKIN